MITALAESVTMPFGERLTTALSNLVLGMLVVFAVLTVLFLVITLVGKIFAARDKKLEASKAEAPKENAENTAVASTSDDAEIVAAITAAITVMLSEENAGPVPFKVVSFRKTNAKPSWNNK